MKAKLNELFNRTRNYATDLHYPDVQIRKRMQAEILEAQLGEWSQRSSGQKSAAQFLLWAFVLMHRLNQGVDGIEIVPTSQCKKEILFHMYYDKMLPILTCENPVIPPLVGTVLSVYPDILVIVEHYLNTGHGLGWEDKLNDSR